MIAEAYVRAGAKVYVSSRKADVVAETESALSQHGECIGIPADLSTEAECRRLAEEISSREDRVHILVNNAGATWGAPLDDYDDAAGPRAGSQRGVFHFTSSCARSSKPRPRTTIRRAITSVDRRHPGAPARDVRPLSAKAVHQLTRHLAKRLSPKVTVNATLGPFESKMMKATLELRRVVAASAPDKRIGRRGHGRRRDSVRGFAYVTGAVNPVDGGIATVGQPPPDPPRSYLAERGLSAETSCFAERARARLEGAFTWRRRRRRRDRGCAARPASRRAPGGRPPCPGAAS